MYTIISFLRAIVFNLIPPGITERSYAEVATRFAALNPIPLLHPSSLRAPQNIFNTVVETVYFNKAPHKREVRSYGKMCKSNSVLAYSLSPDSRQSWRKLNPASSIDSLDNSDQNQQRIRSSNTCSTGRVDQPSLGSNMRSAEPTGNRERFTSVYSAD